VLTMGGNENGLGDSLLLLPAAMVGVNRHHAHWPFPSGMTDLSKPILRQRSCESVERFVKSQGSDQK
jgi:hypothetical protein